MATPWLQPWNRPAAQACPWTVLLDFLEMIRWLHECTVFHSQQFLCLGSCLPTHSFRLTLGGTAPNRVPRVYFSLFYSSSLLSVLFIMPQWVWEHLVNSQAWLQMKSTKHCKYFFLTFWFIFQKQRKNTIQNLDLIFLGGMPGLR